MNAVGLPPSVALVFAAVVVNVVATAVHCIRRQVNSVVRVD